MNREIKFRVWDKQNKKMYFDVQNVSGMNEIAGFASFERILNAPMENEYGEIDNTRRFEVMQYTGLTDKRDKKIFEGDIVKCVDVNSETEFFAVVEFGNPNSFYGWGYQLRHIWGDEPNLEILLWIDMEETGASCEVIGNIFDNPELLNQ